MDTSDQHTARIPHHAASWPVTMPLASAPVAPQEQAPAQQQAQAPEQPRLATASAQTTASAHIGASTVTDASNGTRGLNGADASNGTRTVNSAARTVASTPAPSPVSGLCFEGVGRSFAALPGKKTPGKAAQGKPAQRKDQGSHEVLRGVDLQVEPGEILAIVGPSGCGKSTLLRQMCGLDTPTVGQVTLDGRSVSVGDARTAVAFQEPRLLPWRTVASNVALGLPRGTGKDAARDRVDQLLSLVGLSQAAGLRPRNISGGMAQRVSLARALARQPEVLLLDEPFGALDALTKMKMQDLLLDIHAAQPTTVVLVTHDVEEALYLADRVIVLRSLAAVSQAYQAAGRRDDASWSSIARIVTVPGRRPRDRRALAAMRAELTEELSSSVVLAPQKSGSHPTGY